MSIPDEVEESGPPTPWLPMFGPFAAALVLFALDVRSAAVLVAAIGVVLAIVRLARPGWSAVLDRAFARFGLAVATALSFALITVVFVLVVVPVWLIAGAVRWNPLSLAVNGRWDAERERSDRLRRRTFQREIAPRSPGSRIQGVAVGVVLAALVGLSAFGVATVIRDGPAGPEFTALGPRAAEAADGPVHDDAWATNVGTQISRRNFPGEPWGRAVLEEQNDFSGAGQSRPDDRYGLRNSERTGEHHNVVYGNRVTRAPKGDPEATIWMLGGSTTYGIGQRDDHTIASELVALAEEHGRSIEVVNLGVNSYVNAQETDLFVDRLEAGEGPDAAVFLDGCNEVALAFERERYGLVDPDETVILAATEALQDERAAAAAEAGWVEEHDLDRQVELASAQYRRGVLRAREAARRHGVAVGHFWQPYLLTIPIDAPMTPTVATNVEVPLEWFATAEQLYRRMRETSGVDPIDLSDSLDEAGVPTFFDFCHFNEAGARLQAEAMWPHVEDLLPPG